jgi:hypothetical protein
MKRMILGFIFALCILLAGSTEAHCTVRVAKTAVESTQQPRITAQQYARPRGDVTIEVYRRDHGDGCSQPTGDAQLTLVTDALGKAVLPQLPPGSYYVLAKAKPNLRDDLCLNITRSTAQVSSKFTLELVPYDPPPTYAQIVANAEHSTDVQLIPKFRGVVLDPTGALIRDTSVDVVFKGTEGEKYAAHLHTDEFGRFSANLPEGGYIAFFHAQGFKERVVPLAVSNTDGNGELRVKLQIGDGN